MVKPTRDRQRERLEPRFNRLRRVADRPGKLLELRQDPASIAPERAIVFEVIGELDDFYNQARELGLEYLGDYETEIAPDEDFHYKGSKAEEDLSGRVYLAMPDVQALQELLSLYERFKPDRRMPRGRGEWGKLFSMLSDVRPWGPQDRVPPETIEYWQDSLRQHPERPVRFEAELWYHESPDRQEEARRRIDTEVAKAGGEIIHAARVPEIRYDATLIDLPPNQVRALIDHPDVALARADEIMFLKPQSVARDPLMTTEEGEGEGEGEGLESEETAEVEPMTRGSPIAALFDGLPVQNHVRLQGRLIIDDPDDLEPTYPVHRRRHGTEMASLIVHGDLTRSEPPLPRPVHVRPIMGPDENGYEATSTDRLLVDTLYRAVRRLKEGEGEQPPTAPDVLMVNLSLGDPWRPYAGVMSPLGRLLDYLSWRYSLLFVVSAGNVLDRFAVPAFSTSSEIEDADPADRETAILDALNLHKSQRTLYSPAEAVNVITVGAAHAGSAFNGTLPANLIDPFTDGGLPNVASAMGLGFRKVIKPEILVEGGRTPVRVVGSGDSLVVAPVRNGARYFGARVASPGPRGSDRSETFTWGTSMAAALATRAGHRIHDGLTEPDRPQTSADVPREFLALAIKALLVHGATGWGSKGEFLDNHFGPQGHGSHHARRDDIARLLGYGVPQFDRVLDCTENRATLLGIGTIAADESLLYRIPLPPGLDGVRTFRALTTTLAWFSPVNPRHQGYRVAALDVNAGSEEGYWLTDNRFSFQPTNYAAARGTVYHERRVGEAATVFLDEGHVVLRVDCRGAAGDLDVDVPFAMALSFEVAVEANIPVYDQVRTRLATQVRAGIRAGS
jgi:hypothetical protein